MKNKTLVYCISIFSSSSASLYNISFNLNGKRKLLFNLDRESCWKMQINSGQFHLPCDSILVLCSLDVFYHFTRLFLHVYTISSLNRKENELQFVMCNFHEWCAFKSLSIFVDDEHITWSITFMISSSLSQFRWSLLFRAES